MMNRYETDTAPRVRNVISIRELVQVGDHINTPAGVMQVAKILTAPSQTPTTSCRHDIMFIFVGGGSDVYAPGFTHVMKVEFPDPDKEAKAAIEAIPDDLLFVTSFKDVAILYDEWVSEHDLLMRSGALWAGEVVLNLLDGSGDDPRTTISQALIHPGANAHLAYDLQAALDAIIAFYTVVQDAVDEQMSREF